MNILVGLMVSRLIAGPGVRGLVLILFYFGLSGVLMGRVTAHNPSLLKEHLMLAEKHFPTREQLAQYSG